MIASRFSFNAFALTIITRTVWPFSDGMSLPRATMRIFPSLISLRPNGGADHPISIWPVITCVKVPDGHPVAVGFAFAPSSCANATTMLFELDPLVEYAMVLLAVASFSVLIGECARTYQ